MTHKTAKRDNFDARDERDASAASSDSDVAPEERLERYRLLRDQMRLELEHRELERRELTGRGSPPSTETLRRSVRFDDRPDVFEITADTSHDVTLTSEAGVMEESSTWETSGPSVTPGSSREVSFEQSPAFSHPELGFTQRFGAGTREVHGQSLGQNQGTSREQVPRQGARQHQGQSFESNSAQSSGKARVQGVSQNGSHSPTQSRSISPPLPTHRLNRLPDTTTDADASPDPTRTNGTAAEQPPSRGRKSTAHEPFLFDRAWVRSTKSSSGAGTSHVSIRERAALEAEG